MPTPNSYNVCDFLESSRRLLEQSRRIAASGSVTLQHIREYLDRWEEQKRAPPIESAVRMYIEVVRDDTHAPFAESSLNCERVSAEEPPAAEEKRIAR